MLRRLGLLAGVLAGFLTVVGSASADLVPDTFTPTASYPACSTFTPIEAGPYTISTNSSGRKVVVDGSGNPFVPTGITVYGLSKPEWLNNTGDNYADDMAQIQEMAEYWHANTVRIQADPENLFDGVPSTTEADPEVAENFVDHLLGEVNYARCLGLNVVLTAQTENETGGGAGMPTIETAQYWHYLGTKLFAGWNNIFFDVFNEPRGTDGSAWSTWCNGGSGDIGMNELVTDIHNMGIGRLLWVQGINDANTLSGITACNLNTYTAPSGSTDPYASTSGPLSPGTNLDVVYDIHHPTGDHDTTAWATDFGDIATAAGDQPVVVGEWTQYASTKSECWTDARSAVPAFLSYVQSLGLGIISWTLNDAQVLNVTRIDSSTGATAADPSTMPVDYSCDGTTSGGAGLRLLDWFEANES